MSNKYNIIPATKDDMDWIASQQSHFYSPADCISNELLREWFAHNERGFFIIQAHNSQKIGHVDILPLRDEILSEFKNGNITEKDIRGIDIYSKQEAKYIRNLYIESVALIKYPGSSNYPLVKFVMAELRSIIGHICPIEQIEMLYAIEGSLAGERLMRHLGFVECGNPQLRKDRHKFFSIEAEVLLSSLSKYELH